MEFDSDSIIMEPTTLKEMKTSNEPEKLPDDDDSMMPMTSVLTSTSTPIETTTKENIENLKFIPIPNLYKDIAIVTLLALVFIRLIIDFVNWIKRKRSNKPPHYPMDFPSVTGSSVSVFNSSKID